MYLDPVTGEVIDPNLPSTLGASSAIAAASGASLPPTLGASSAIAAASGANLPPTLGASSAIAAASSSASSSASNLPPTLGASSAIAAATAAGPIGSQSAAVYMFRWLLAWAIVILLASIANRTRLGHTIIYYLLALALFFLIVTQYRWFAAALSPITGTSING